MLFSVPVRRGRRRGVATSAKMDEFCTKFATEFALVVSLATSVTSSSVWFVNNGVSCHVVGARKHFTSLTEDDIDMEVVLGDNSKI